MTNITQPYNDLVKKIIEQGESKTDRTNTGTISLFGETLTFNVSKYAPLITERRVPLLSTAGELIWFLIGSTDAARLKHVFKCNFWDEWASPIDNDIGPMYGKQWRDSDGVDQFKRLIDDMIKTPDSRRLIVNTWVPRLIPDNGTVPSMNPEQGKMALAPCHMSYQLNVVEKYRVRYVDLKWYQRSADVMLGLPINIASYYFLLCIICKICTKLSGVEYLPRNLHCHLGDAHIYKNHVDQVKREYLRRTHFESPTFECPDEVIDLLSPANLTERTLVDIQHAIADAVSNYKYNETIKFARNV